jgi:hypothetical protein
MSGTVPFELSNNPLHKTTINSHGAVPMFFFGDTPNSAALDFFLRFLDQFTVAAANMVPIL